VIVDGKGDTVIEYTSETSPRSIVVPIAFSLLAIGVTGLIIRYFIVKKKVEEIAIQKKISRVREPSTQEMTEKKIIAQAGETIQTVGDAKTN
jgi:hypothetical protein